MSQERSAVPEFGLDGAALCLDFVNTLGDRPLGRQERLRGYDDFLLFAAAAGLVPKAELPKRRKRAARAAPRAQAVFARALELREALYRVFASRGRAARPSPADLAVVNEALRRAAARQRLKARGQALDWQWEERDDLEYPLWPIARSAADLLLSDDCVRECASDSCSWLFVDRGPAGRRRWCDMNTCGNREKARRFYERARSRRS